MKITKQNLYLTLSGLLLFVIGGFIAGVPSAYLQQFGSESSYSVSFYSELRAFGTGLLGVSIISIVSLFVSELRLIALSISTVIFSSYFFGRVVSLCIDGIPNQGILFAAGIEILFTTAGVLLLKKELHSWS